MMIVEQIHVTENERGIFDLLLRAVRNFSPETDLRVAGGWVRDKLLGLSSSDIDIAISNMLPSDFLVELNDYLRSQGEDQVQGHVIQSKPAAQGTQKQPLETVKMSLYNQSIDLVHLRRDTYAGDSRIPVKVEFASPLEDAYRRDLTINSLFYNIHTGLVEDLTGRGIDDLKSGRIATPLPARETFLKDPLRVLRAIRLGARLDFTMDEQLKEAASSEEVRVAIAGLISRERIGNEMDLMISENNRPVSAVNFLSDLKLLGLVFALPASSEPAPSEKCLSLGGAYMEAMWKLIQTPGFVDLSGEKIRHALHAALLLPFRKMVYKEKKGKSAPVVNYILKVSMKRKSSDAKTVVNIHRATGILIVDSSSSVEEWRTSGQTHDEEEVNLDFQLDKKRETYLRIEGSIREMNLDTIWDEKPLLDGFDIIKSLQLTNRGPIIRQWQQKLLTWQLAYPDGMPTKRAKPNVRLESKMKRGLHYVPGV